MKWTAQVWARVDRLRAAGRSRKEIAAVLGVKVTAFYEATKLHPDVRRKRGPIEWTAARDAAIRRRRADGRGYPAIAAELGLSNNTVAEHIDCAQQRAGLRQPGTNLDRPPLPAGDPVSWGLLLALTPSLGNLPYPPYRPLICRRPKQHVDEMRLAA
jgi:hypothetical protein